MEEKKNTGQTESFWDAASGFLTDRNLLGKLRWMAKAALVFGLIIVPFSAFFIFYAAAVVPIVLCALGSLGIAWLLFAVANIYEKTAENNDILRKAFPECVDEAREVSTPE